MIARRSLLAAGLAGLSLAATGARASFATGAAEGRFVLVILRGALDGLAAVAPVSDPAYRGLRGALALDQTLPMAEGMGLHPSLARLHGLWQARQLTILHASATPYRDRSHFDGQDVLEGGTDRAFGQTGWLNRAIGLLPPSREAEAVAIGRTVPLVLRGPGKATSWAPADLPQTSADTLARLMDLYAADPLLGPALASAVETSAVAMGMAPAMATDGPRRPASGGARGAGANLAAQWAGLGSATARLLTAPEGPVAAAISLDGWDTHANQGAGDGLLAGRLAALDALVGAVQTGLGPHWGRTSLVIATEFGRTVRVNGTGGTDHGTGGVAFLAGGQTTGGRFAGDWPGLASLYQDRDLIPASDVRTLFATGLELAFSLSAREIQGRVFQA